uniref:Ubiquitin carboxyl-terminal hydrolase 7 ICP0-binding domain-containing protein n=1 Tax=Aegilops tauschii subsp. strangulata TaxID=200361 RepID=A0A453CK80_AEGTS
WGRKKNAGSTQKEAANLHGDCIRRRCCLAQLRGGAVSGERSPASPSRRSAAAMQPRNISIKVAREEDMSSQIGNDGFYFDLVDFDRVKAFQIADNMTMSRLKMEIAVEFSIPVQCQRLWLFCKRQNGTWRPVKPFSTEENNLSMTSLGRLLSRTFLFLNPDGVKLFLEVLNDSSPKNLSNNDGLVFLKLYDPEQTQIRYIGMVFVKASSRPSDILPKLRSLAGFCADEEMELYEEIKFEPSAMCDAIDANITFSESQIGQGDIICYQKSSKSLSHHAYPSVQIFFNRIHDLKAVVPVSLLDAYFGNTIIM